MATSRTRRHFPVEPEPMEHAPTDPVPAVRALDEDTFPAAPTPPAVIEALKAPPAKKTSTLMTVVLEGMPGIEERLQSIVTEGDAISGLADVFTHLARHGHRGEVTITFGSGRVVHFQS